jgi:hypothetical protein
MKKFFFTIDSRDIQILIFSFRCTDTDEYLVKIFDKVRIHSFWRNVLRLEENTLSNIVLTLHSKEWTWPAANGFSAALKVYQREPALLDVK